MEAKYIVIGRKKHTTRRFNLVTDLVRFMEHRNPSDYLIYALTEMSVVTVSAKEVEKTLKG
jgi:hypothetical protein